MTTMQSIADEIDKLVEANTLSGAGVKAMEALRVRVVEQEKLLEQSRENGRIQSVELGQTKTLYANAQARNATWDSREAALVKREAEITKLEKDAAVAAGKSQTYQECFALVFRNAEIRETLKSTTPVVYPNIGGGTGYANVHETRNEVTRQQT